MFIFAPFRCDLRLGKEFVAFIVSFLSLVLKSELDRKMLVAKSYKLNADDFETSKLIEKAILVSEIPDLYSPEIVRM